MIPIVDVYTIGYNEEKILPYFIHHYKQFCRNITYYNNCSTDLSKEICLKNNVKVIDTNLNEINELEYLKIKHNCYKNSDADFVIVVDCDEFLFHPDMKNLLSYYLKEGVNYPKIRGYTMVSKNGFPAELNITDYIKTGETSKRYAKRCIFSPKLNITWDVGCHDVINYNISFAKESEQEDIALLHYKFIDLQDIKKKRREYSNRISLFNMKYKLAECYFNYNEKEVEDNFNGYIERMYRVI